MSFSWLIEINITDVPILELSNGTFKFEFKTYGRHGVATKVKFYINLYDKLYYKNVYI